MRDSNNKFKREKSVTRTVTMSGSGQNHQRRKLSKNLKKNTMDAATERKTYWQSMLKNKTMKPTVITHVVTILIIICYLLNTLGRTLNFWGVIGNAAGGDSNGESISSDEACNATQAITIMFFHSGKTGIYFIFIMRVYTAFQGSKYQYSKKLVQFLFFLLFCALCIYIFGDIFQTDGYWVYDDKYNTWWCQIEAQRWGVFFTILMDLFFSVVCLVLFTKPIKKIMKQAKSDKLQKLNIKYTTLTWLAVLSTC